MAQPQQLQLNGQAEDADASAQHKREAQTIALAQTLVTSDQQVEQVVVAVEEKAHPVVVQGPARTAEEISMRAEVEGMVARRREQEAARLAKNAEEEKREVVVEEKKVEQKQEQDSGLIQQLAGLAIGGTTSTAAAPPPPPPKAEVQLKDGQLLETFDLAGVAKLIKDGKAKRIVCMCGAGISVSAGIPDFRTPGTGLYSQLAKYKLPRPEAVFSIDFFRHNPEPFHRLARELYPGSHKPTPTHYFMTLLDQKGLLLRCFTQNIDSLEAIAGLDKDRVVAAHGNFDSASCIKCSKVHSTDWVKQTIMAGKICHCASCSGLVKPDIVFFGESLPLAFDIRSKHDMPQCDLLIVMGTSLVVHPFAGLLYEVPPTVPRLLINREVVGLADQYDRFSKKRSPGFQFDEEVNYRDALHLGDCDEGVMQLADLLGWREELEALVAQGHAHVEANSPQKTAGTSSCLPECFGRP